MVFKLIFGIILFIIIFYYIFVAILEDTYGYLNSKLKFVVISSAMGISAAVAAISVLLLWFLFFLI